MDNGLQHYIFMYVYIHCFNSIWRLEYLKTLEWFCFSLKYKGLLNSPNKKFVLSRSFLNFLRIFCKLKEQFLRVWENFVPPSGIRQSFFASGQGIRQKKLPGWPGLTRSKKISRGLLGGGGGCTQLELTETLDAHLYPDTDNFILAGFYLLSNFLCILMQYVWHFYVFRCNFFTNKHYPHVKNAVLAVCAKPVSVWV